MDQTGQQEGSLSDTGRVIGQAIKAVTQKIGKEIKSKAIDAGLALASGGTSLLAKGVKTALEAKKRLDTVGSIDKIGFLGGGKISWERLAAIGVCSILAFFLITITTIAGAFIPGSKGLGEETGDPGSRIILTENLVELFRQVAKNECLPLALIMAISKQEAGDIWTYSPEEILKFSTPDWWESATSQEIIRGYCRDTCSYWPSPCAFVSCNTGENSGYRETTVYGPMQFEECTWYYRMPGYKSMDRCRLDLAVSAAGKKLHDDGGANTCINWSNDELLAAIRKYCGSCNSSSCPGYCDKVMLWYNEFISQYPNE